MSRSDLLKAEKSAAKIAKIEPMNPETMLYGAIKDELLMRLHDAALIYGANLSFNAATAFEKAQRAVIEGDLHEGFKAAEQYIKELPNFENAERTKALWLELIRRKNDPAYGSLAKFGIIEKASGKYWCAGFSWSADPLLALRFASKTSAKAEFSDIHDSLGHPAKLEIVEITAPSSALVKVEQFDLIETEVVDEFGMSQAEYLHLSLLEDDIKKGLDLVDKGRTLVGDSLKEIRDKKLYRAYGTFEAYCEQNRGFSRSRAYQFIAEANIVDNLLTAGINPEALPANEGQVRALSSVPEDKQAEVWCEVKASGKPTAAKIKAIAKAAVVGESEIPPNPPCKGGQREDEWNPNLWETPEHIARAMAMLLEGGESILEPCAGTGQICRAVVDIFGIGGWEYELTAIEILKERAAKLEDNRYFSIDADFLEFDFGSNKFDVVLTNPPFDIGMKILKRSLELIKAEGRCLFLLPSAYFQTQERAKEFFALNCHIHKVHPIIGRVPYLKEGVPVNGRQCEDSVFDIRMGKDDACMEFIYQ